MATRAGGRESTISVRQIADGCFAAPTLSVAVVLSKEIGLNGTWEIYSLVEVQFRCMDRGAGNLVGSIRARAESRLSERARQLAVAASQVLSCSLAKEIDQSRLPEIYVASR